MAPAPGITTLQSPNTISAVYNPMFFLNNSSYSGETGFRYVYSLSDENGLICTKQVLPFPNGYGRIDVSNILKSYLSYDLNYNTTGITTNYQCIKEYDTLIGYTGGTHTNTGGADGVKFCINAVDNNDFTYNDYILSGTSAKFLTHSPTNIDIFLTDYYTLGFLNGLFGSQMSSVKYVYVKTYGTSTGTYRMTNPDYEHNPGGTLVNVDVMSKVAGVGPMNINASTLYNTGSMTDETKQFIHTGTTYYEVWSADVSANRTSRIYTFTLNNYPARYGKYQVAFLNRSGQFSYFTFVGKTIETTKQVKSTFLKNRYSLNGTSWTTDISSRGTDIYNNSTSTEYTFQSDYIDQSTFDFCEELFTSPQLFYLSQLGAVPLIVMDTDWVNKKKVNDKLISFSIKAESSNDKKINI